MRQEKEDGFLKFLFGVFFGIVAGYTAGILSAERPGRELRRDLEASSSVFMDGLKDRLDDLKDQASDKLQDFKGYADEKLRRSAENIQEQVDSLGKQLEELTEKQAASMASKRN